MPAILSYPIGPNSVAEMQQSYLFQSIEPSNDWIDPFTPLFRQILALPRPILYQYETSVPVSSHSQSMYGTISLWPIFVVCSGYVHPQVIPNLSTFGIPNLPSVYALVKEERETLAGKTIIF